MPRYRQVMESAALGLAALFAALMGYVFVVGIFNAAASDPPARGERDYWTVISLVVFFGVLALFGLLYGRTRSGRLSASAVAAGWLLSAGVVAVMPSAWLWTKLGPLFLAALVGSGTTLAAARQRSRPVA